MDQRESRIVRIGDGQFAQVVDRSALLPTSLEALLLGMRGSRETTVRLLGTRQACTEGEHDLQLWRQGVFRGMELRLRICGFCSMVEVRDVSLDILPITPTGKAERRDALLGWYAGKRPAARQYI